MKVSLECIAIACAISHLVTVSANVALPDNLIQVQTQGFSKIVDHWEASRSLGEANRSLSSSVFQESFSQPPEDRTTRESLPTDLTICDEFFFGRQSNLQSDDIPFCVNGGLYVNKTFVKL